MNEINNDTESFVDEKNYGKEHKKRVTWVSKDHKSMMDFVAVIYKNLGHTNFHSNKEIAEQHGLLPDSIKQHLSSAQQYKLLEIKFGIGYKITDLFKRIYLYVHEAERKSAITESLKSPDTYSSLFREYENHILPPISGLKNHFVRNFHLKEDTAEKTAQIFIDNLNEYGFLDARGILSTDSIKEESHEVIDSVINNDKPAEETKMPVKRGELIENLYTGESNKKIPIFLTQKKIAFLVYPDDITEKDIKIIEHQVEGILLRLQLDKDELNE